VVVSLFLTISTLSALACFTTPLSLIEFARIEVVALSLSPFAFHLSLIFVSLSVKSPRLRNIGSPSTFKLCPCRSAIIESTSTSVLVSLQTRYWTSNTGTVERCSKVHREMRDPVSKSRGPVHLEVWEEIERE
jgi:hypothetical protein